MPTAPVTCAATPARCAVIGDSKAGYDDPYRVFIRIQSDLDRIAAGQPRRTVPAGASRDPMESIVDAYAAYLQHDGTRMNEALTVAVDSAQQKMQGMSQWQKPMYETYNAHLADVLRTSQPLPHLLAAIRIVDTALYYETGGLSPEQRDDQLGMHSSTPQPQAGLWLRLPCRTLHSHENDFAANADALKSLPGPLLDCPSDDQAITSLVGIAGAPRLLKPHQTPDCPNGVARDGTCYAAIAPSKPSPPSPREVAIASMATHPDAADPVLKQAAEKDLRGELDYALFLHAFRPRTPARDAQIQHLLDDVQAKSYVHQKPTGEFPITAYDGSDDSLVPRIILASMGEDRSVSQYAISCDVLQARPALVAATQARYGSNMDNFLPRSGCDEAGDPAGYPTEAVATFSDDATNADGHFIDNFGGSMVYGFEKEQNSTETALKVDPASFLLPVVANVQDYPYQNWGYLGLNNYRISLRLIAEFETAQRKLADYYVTMHMSHEQGMQAARNGLFALVFGGDCGQSMPDTSPRVLLLKHAPLLAIQAALDKDDHSDELLAGCAQFGGIDPLLLIASGGYPEALDLLLAHGATVNDGNTIGKTALMEAAQFNQGQSVHMLLQRDANPNATTWPANDDALLHHDGRTALMYAAANASLSTIKLLLVSGADPYQTDSKGFRAIDYLLGYGPTPPNPVLSHSDRVKAQELLY
ncbi:ankyrin repeat domain-containing protein [Dyella lipolytica]|uniref:ankyrin repeat domain-containing protein n=1 Tax=Dyella lipolytica TaxID=1867835 RepID=UPI0024E1571A|nr:ankyrin repeat domain-containing protein [Dyella lipolytica]